MAKIYNHDSEIVERLKNTIRDDNAPVEVIRGSINSLAHIAAQEMHKIDVSKASFVTPMGAKIEGEMLSYPSRIVITTREDRDTMGEPLSIAFGSCGLGFMDFEGRRALEALNQPVRHIEFPKNKSPVDTLIIAKVVLATGCTAISLTKAAINYYGSTRLFIVSLFYSEQGLSDLRVEFPSADIFLIGKPDRIRSDGMLVPGVGNLDERVTLYD